MAGFALSVSFLFLCEEACAQRFTGEYSLDAFVGQLILRPGLMSAVENRFAYGFRASYGWRTNGRKYWQQAYKYPSYGVSAMVVDFRTRELGVTTALTGYYDFHIIHPDRLVNLDFRIDVGVAVHSKPFNRENNFYNVAIGSRVTTAEAFSLNLMFNVSPRFRLGAGAEFIHFSNGDTHCPNYGLNLFNASIKAVYSPKERVYYTPADSPQDAKEPYRFNLHVSAGIHQPFIPIDKYFPFFVVYGGVHKRFSTVSGVNLGLDVSYSLAKREYAKLRKIWYNEKIPDPTTLAISGGYEFFLNRLSGNVSVGYYLYNKMSFDDRVFERLGLKYYFTRRLYASFGLKASLFVAEAIEYGIGFLF